MTMRTAGAKPATARLLQVARLLNVLLGCLLVGSYAAVAADLPRPAASAAASSSERAVEGVAANTVSGIALGFHTHFHYGHSGGAVSYAPIAALSKMLGHPPALIHGFYSWKNPDGSDRPFPKDFADYAVSQGATPLITWQPGQADEHNQVERPQADWTCTQIASGRYDAYIATWAQTAKAYPHTLYVRLMHEFNAAPYPWAYSVDQQNNTPEKYVAAFRHVVAIFQRLQVTNVQFIWCFGCGAHEPPPENWFPGDAYVDWIGLDGYNYGFTKDGSQKRWRTVEEIFDWSYSRLTKISVRPVMIAEIGCVEDVDKKGSTTIVDKTQKRRWIADTFLNTLPQKMPRVKAVVLFNSVGHNFPTYVIDSSPESLAAFRAVAASPLYQAPAPPKPLKY
jgi:hypothetical protein